MTDDLSGAILAVLDQARKAARTDDDREQLAEIHARLTGPLRLAIAGKVKAGKSTLLNALLGEELAPTDAGECTKIVTWYSLDDRPHATLFPLEGKPRERPYDRDGGALQVDLGGLRPADVDHLEIGWPTSRLRELTILDTPGIASISADVSARTQRVLAADDGRVPVADAILYLLRHTHSSDIRFLESFHDDELAHGTPMNAIGVLSRADEIGSCRLDSMEVAERVAKRYEAEPRLHRLCPVIVPVNGLLGHTATTLREAEYALLATIARAPGEEVAELLLTADRFTSTPTGLPVTELEREHLLGRLGLYGVRLSVELIRSGTATNSSELSTELTERSGLNRLRTILVRQFETRSRVLKSYSAVAALADLLRSGDFDAATELQARVEEISAGAHEFQEIRLLSELRSGGITLKPERVEQLDRLLGGSGHDPSARLGLGADASADEVREAALAALTSWQAFATHPLTSRPGQLAARVATRTLEGLLADTGH
ncbi:dynamin family protein [Kribbella qitaiheensis]|uniref:dynamin family protein n=1 Tax=Kribbella qitaiheensis TaxID=1544730 RepID=UPI00361102F9